MNKYAKLYFEKLGATIGSSKDPYGADNVAEGIANFFYNIPGSTFNAATGMGNLGIKKIPLTKPDFRLGTPGLAREPGKGITAKTVRDNAPNAVRPPSAGAGPHQLQKILGGPEIRKATAVGSAPAASGAGPSEAFLKKVMGSYDPNSKRDQMKAEAIRKIYRDGISPSEIYADKGYSEIDKTKAWRQ